ncbi:MAG: FHA domain-containing protein [Anaerolineae bacterium]
MKVLKYLFGIPGGILVLVAFFLPWAHATFAPRGISGRDFTLGYGGTSTQISEFVGESAAVALARGDAWLWVIFGVGVLAIIATLFSFLRLQKAPIVTGVTLIISSLVGFAFLYLRAADFLAEIDSTINIMLAARSLFQGFSPSDGIVISVGIGLYLSLTGLFLMIIGGIFAFAPTPSPRTVAIPEIAPPADQVTPKSLTPSPFPVQQGPAPVLLSKDTVPDIQVTIADEPAGQFQAPSADSARASHPHTIIDDRPAGVGRTGPLDPTSAGLHEPPDQAKTFAWLIARNARGLTAGGSFTISADKFTIGRGTDNMLPLPDTSVSTRHAEIRQEESAFFVYDLGSSNGTYLFDRAINDWRRVEHIALRDGDQIKFGRSTFSFVDVKNQSK